MAEQTDLTRMQKAMEGSKKNATGIGGSAAVVLTWAITTYAGVVIPPEVVVSLGVVIGGVARGIQN